MNWGTTRKIIYAVSIFLLLVGASLFAVKDKLFPKPTCNDGKQNGYESGIDCGGLCALRCENEIIPITMLWSRALPVVPHIYDLVAFVSNKNSDTAPVSLTATFTVFDEQGVSIFKKTIPTTPPAATDMPILIQNVYLPSEPKNITVDLSQGASYKIDPRFQSTQISTVRSSFENGDTPRVYATVRNLTRIPFTNIKARVVLYDETQNAIATGETIIERLDKEAEQTIVFTWKQKFATPPTLIRVYPVLDPFSM